MIRYCATNESKARARQTVMETTQRFLGRKSLPLDRTCVALCGQQLDHPMSQVNQYVESGFMQAHQYIGIDRDEKDTVLAGNRLAHPGVEFIKGEWRDCLPSLMKRSPVLFDLDTMSLGSTAEAHDWLARTMSLAEPGSVIAFNSMRRCGYQKKIATSDDVVEGLKHRLTPRVYEAWNRVVDTFPYTSQRMPMFTMIFHRPEALEALLAA